MSSLQGRCLGAISDSRREKEKENQEAKRGVTNEVASNLSEKVAPAGRQIWPTKITAQGERGPVEQPTLRRSDAAGGSTLRRCDAPTLRRSDAATLRQEGRRRDATTPRRGGRRCDAALREATLRRCDAATLRRGRRRCDAATLWRGATLRRCHVAQG